MYKTKAQLCKAVNNAICGAAPGIFTDSYWHGHGMILDALKPIDGIEIIHDRSEYKWFNADSYDSMPNAKEWTYDIIDGKHTVFMLITASGAGSVSDPLEKYDITAYAS